MKKIIIGIIVLAAFLGGYFLVKEVSKPLPGRDVPDQGRKHVEEKVWNTFKYNSNPPTSGPHDAVWIKKGIYTTSAVKLGKGHLLHSLEHGYIEIHYNCTISENGERTSDISTEQRMDDPVWGSQSCKDLVKQLTDIVNEKTLWKMILVPNPTIDTRISIAAWNRIDTMNKVKKAEIEDFIDSFRDHGPEQTMEP